MNRRRIASALAGLAAVGFLGTAWLHSTGYGAVADLAAEVSSDLGSVMPALWLMFSLDLAVLGLIVVVVAYHPTRLAGRILLIVALCPLGAAALQLVFIGFILPTAILLSLGILTLVAAAVAATDTGARAT